MKRLDCRCRRGKWVSSSGSQHDPASWQSLRVCGEPQGQRQADALGTACDQDGRNCVERPCGSHWPGAAQPTISEPFGESGGSHSSRPLDCRKEPFDRCCDVRRLRAIVNTTFRPAINENQRRQALDKPWLMRYHPASEFPDMVARIAGVSKTTPCFRCGATRHCGASRQ
jgi:hypothetical protein